MSARFADLAVLDEVSDVAIVRIDSGKSEPNIHAIRVLNGTEITYYVNPHPKNLPKSTHDNLCATAKVVRPFAAWSSAS